MDHIGDILPGFLVDLMGNEGVSSSIICRKSAIVEQLEELIAVYGAAEPTEVFKLQVDMEGGTITLTIDRYKEVRDRLPGKATDQQIEQAFHRLFGKESH